MRSESEANHQTFYAKRSEANSLRFAFFRINANSQCEFGPLHDLENVFPNVSVLVDNGNICADLRDRAAKLAVSE